MGLMWRRLGEELDRWQARGLKATFWWRDDDAVDTTPALERLLNLAGRVEMPLTLAAIPVGASSRLAARIDTGCRVDVVQHGFSHRNHGAPGSKKIELAAERPRAEVLAQLEDGLGRLRQLFAERALPVMVPPWNRIPEDLIGELPKLGYRGLSTFGPRPSRYPFPGFCRGEQPPGSHRLARVGRICR